MMGDKKFKRMINTLRQIASKPVGHEACHPWIVLFGRLCEAHTTSGRIGALNNECSEFVTETMHQLHVDRILDHGEKEHKRKTKGQKKHAQPLGFGSSGATAAEKQSRETRAA